MNRAFLAGLLALLIVGSLVWYTYQSQGPGSPESVYDIDEAAKKASVLQDGELRATVTALERDDSGKVIWGDRFLRWTVLAYTLWRLDRGDQTVIPEMEELLVLYYRHAWYPYVKNGPEMPFPSLISYFRADGTWEDYWNDYKPVYASAFVLEYYLLATYDHAWGTRHFPILKNVTDSIIRMWLPARHQPTAYVDAFKTGSVEVVEVKNIVCSVDSAIVGSALTAAAQLARTLANDPESAKTYESYADDLYSHFKSEKWEWFPTNILGNNTSEDYGAALQLGMTIPSIDADDKIELYAQKVNSSLRLSPDSWLLKWKPSDTEPSSRSVYAAIGLASKYPEMGLRILISYAHRALIMNPWFTSKTDGYEAEDPIWVSGKFLQAYVMFKQRAALGKSIFSPSVMRGELGFQTSLKPGRFGIQTFSFIFPNLCGGAFGEIEVSSELLTVQIHGFQGRNVSLAFPEGPSKIRVAPGDIPHSTHSDPMTRSITLRFFPDSRQVTITIQ